jgi:EAL domain-containing protein (putative c-di-GMP-specific phosphodiesterase class I)
VNQDRIFVHYQPIVELSSGKTVKAEALARWTHPLLGSIPPSDFIPLAEESGVIHKMGDNIFKAAAETARAWNALSGGGMRIGVNRSPRQFQIGQGNPSLMDFMMAHSLDFSSLGVEITEGMLLENRPEILRQLVELRQAGATVSLDDFGTGYSALSYLKKFPIDFLKIDKSFISGIDTDANDLAIVGAIIAMAKQLGIKLIAEGVETLTQAEILRGMGCDMAQGFFFGRPMPADQFLRFVENDLR